MTMPFLGKEDNPHFILNELRSGNPRAFDFIFKEYYASLSRFAFSFVKDQDQAENLVQEVLIKLWEKRKNLMQIDNLCSYLLTMVRNQSTDSIRKEKATTKVLLNLHPEESANTTEEQISKNEFEEKLLLSLIKLPERCRMAFEMSRFDGISNKDIAQKLDISVKGVEALIGRSLKLLRTELMDFLPSAQKGRSAVLFSLLFNRLGLASK
jgi:RNA polymerase sigma-70 factor (ECF subfamily)